SPRTSCGPWSIESFRWRRFAPRSNISAPVGTSAKSASRYEPRTSGDGGRGAAPQPWASDMDVVQDRGAARRGGTDRRACRLSLRAATRDAAHAHAVRGGGAHPTALGAVVADLALAPARGRGVGGC